MVKNKKILRELGETPIPRDMDVKKEEFYSLYKFKLGNEFYIVKFLILNVLPHEIKLSPEDRTTLISCCPNKEEFTECEITFGITYEPSSWRINTYELTNTGSAAPLFSIIDKLLFEFKETHQFDYVTFAAWQKEPSRVRLYQLFTKRLAHEWDTISFVGKFPEYMYAYYYILHPDLVKNKDNKIMERTLLREIGDTPIPKDIEYRQTNINEEKYRWTYQGRTYIFQFNILPFSNELSSTTYPIDLPLPEKNKFLLSISKPIFGCSPAFGITSNAHSWNIEDSSLTNDGSPAIIFGVQLALLRAYHIQNYIQKKKYSFYFFAAASNEPSRVRAYKTMALWLSRKMGTPYFMNTESTKYPFASYFIVCSDRLLEKKNKIRELFDSNNDIVNSITQQLQTQGAGDNAADQASQAWELAKTQAQAAYRPEQPEYWPHVQKLSYDLLGLEQATDRPIVDGATQNNSFNGNTGPSRSLKIGSNTEPGMFSKENQSKTKGYPSYGESTKKISGWAQTATIMVKHLKNKRIKKNEIIYSLVNRLGISPEVADLIYQGKYQDESIKQEDTTSDAFEAAPFDSKHNFHKDGKRINTDAHQSLITMGIIEEAVSNEEEANFWAGDSYENLQYTLPPKKTMIAYKLFRKMKNRPGLFPLFIGKTIPTPEGVWVEAKFIPTPGFDKRPGWHVGTLPVADHLKQKSTGTYAPDRVWAEVEIPADIDWQPVADASKSKDIKNRVPKGGFYRFKRPKNQGGMWLIAGAIKVNRVLSNDEVNEILSEY